MARLKRWSAALASISLLLFAGVAGAEPSRQIDLPVALPVEVVLPGLEQALATDPSVVRADVDTQRGVLRLTGLLLRQETVVYAWTSGSMIVFTAKVTAPPEDPNARKTAPRPSGEGAGSLYRLSVGSGFRTSHEGGHRRLPIAFGASAFKPLGGSKLSFNGTSRPFGEDREDQQATGSGVATWRLGGYKFSAGDQPIDFGHQMLTSFPLRGVTADAKIGPATITAFGGTRTTPELRLRSTTGVEGEASMIGGLKSEWAVSPALKLSGTVALTDTEPLASIAAEWRHGIWSAMFETAATAERRGASLRLRHETDRLTIEERLTFRSEGESLLLSGAEGLGSETAANYRFSRDLGVTGRVIFQPIPPAAALSGNWHIGGDWAPTGWLNLGTGIDRTFDGAVTTMTGTMVAQSPTVGSAAMTVARTVRDDASGSGTQWFQSVRAERPVTSLGPVKRLTLEETLNHTDLSGSLSVSAGVEVEAGWLKASLAPGFIVPTVTDPNGIAETLRLRVTATPSSAFQLQTEVRQTFGAKPDTTVQFGVGVGFGSASPLGSPLSWLSRSSVEGIVFVDDNGNGRWDAGERGLPGVPVQLADGNTVTTDENGRYRLKGLTDGTHHVGVGRDNLPANLRLASASPVAVRMPDGARTVSFAFVGTGMIHGMIFNDLTFSRRFTGSEPGIAADVLIEGAGVRRQIAANGSFSVSGLAPGRYRVTVDPLSLPASYVMERTEMEVDIDAGDSATAQFPVVALRAVSILACVGRGAGVCDADERAAAGLRVTAGTTTVVTDAKGRALVRQLPAGKLTVTVDPASVPAGFTAPRPMTIDIPSDPTALPVSIRLEPVRR